MSFSNQLVFLFFGNFSSQSKSPFYSMARMASFFDPEILVVIIIDTGYLVTQL